MRIEFTYDLPSSNYSLSYHSSYYNKDTNELIAIWQVTQSDGFGMMMITSGNAEKEIPIIGTPTIKHYLIGHPWGQDDAGVCTHISGEQVAEVTVGFNQL